MNTENRKNRCPWGLYPILLLAGIFLLFLRNPDPIINPVVYAEDGTWVALGLREGWMAAFAFSRPDYFVFLNTILLYISTIISTATNGGLIDHLPYAIAFVSYLFYSAFALLVFITVKRISSGFFGIFAFLLVLMLPLGTTQNEIIGRILQIGFFMPALALMLFFWRDRCVGASVRSAIDLAIFISAGTNPVVFVLAFSYFLYVVYLNNFNYISALKKNALLISLLSVLAVVILPRLGGHGGVPGDFVASNAIEAVTARSVLFPFIFPWYGELSNALSLSILSVFALIVVIAIRVSKNIEAKRLTYALVVATIIYTFLTVLMRPGLTGLLNNYQTSFPDRYFMGINVLVSMLVVLVVIQLFNSVKTRVLGVIIGSSVVLVYIYSNSAIFEFQASRLPIRNYLSFKDQVCLSEPVSGSYKIQIYPELPGWNMIIPAKYVNKVDCGFRSYDELGVSRPGDEYKMIATPPLEINKNIPISIFGLATRKPVSRIEVMFGTHMRLNSGDAQLILRESNGRSEKIDFPLTRLQDNRYQVFEVPEGRYVSGEIQALTGQGVSVWESHNQEGKVLSCLKFKYTDGAVGFTPGCPR